MLVDMFSIVNMSVSATTAGVISAHADAFALGTPRREATLRRSGAMSGSSGSARMMPITPLATSARRGPPSHMRPSTTGGAMANPR